MENERGQGLLGDGGGGIPDEDRGSIAVRNSFDHPTPTSTPPPRYRRTPRDEDHHHHKLLGPGPAGRSLSDPPGGVAKLNFFK
eukprot:758907-Hanusia_phi.AAC.2